MKGGEILDVIEQIAATSSSNEKAKILKSHIQDFDFHSVIVEALDPYITFGIADLKFLDGRIVLGHGENDFDSSSMLLLGQLAKRELTGNDAKAAIAAHMASLNEKGIELFKRVLLKDLRAGISSKTVNKAVPGSIREFSVMLAQPYEGQSLPEKVLVEEKLDGIRCVVIIEEGIAKAFTRSGREIFTIDHVLKDIEALGLNGIVLDGEVMADTFNQTVSEVRKKDKQAENTLYHIFDVVTLEDFRSGWLHQGLAMRKRNLYIIAKDAEQKNLPSLRFIAGKICHSMSEIRAYRDEVWERGGEGVIIKTLHAPYEKKRSKAWLKIKGHETHDCLVKAVIEGTGKYADMMGAIVIDFNGMSVNIGTGFTDHDRESIWEDYKQGGVVGRLIEVGAHEQTPDGSLRHPRFVRWRDSSDRPGVKI